MPRQKKSEIDVEVFDGFTAQELKDVIVRNVRQMKKNAADLKAYRNSIVELNNELDARNDAALEELDRLRAEDPSVDVQLPALDEE